MQNKDGFVKRDLRVSVNILNARIEALLSAIGQHNPAIMKDYEAKFSELMQDESVFVTEDQLDEEIRKDDMEWKGFMKQMNM